MTRLNPRYSGNNYQNNFGQYRNGQNDQNYPSNYQRNNFNPRGNTFTPRRGYFQRNRYAGNEQDRGRSNGYQPENDRGRFNWYRPENESQGYKPTQNYGAKLSNGSYQKPRI